MNEPDVFENAFEIEPSSQTDGITFPPDIHEVAAQVDDDHQPPVSWRELICVVGLVALSDVTIYQGGGYAGLGVLMVGAPLLFWIGSPLQRGGVTTRLVFALLVLLAARLVWCGSGLATSIGFALLSAFVASLAGVTPFVLRAFVFGASVVVEGHAGLKHYSKSLSQWKPSSPRATNNGSNSLAVVLPVVAVGVFGTFFVLANPDLLKLVSVQLETFFRNIQTWLIDVVPWPTQVLFWIAVVWLAVGALRPVSVDRSESTADDEKLPPIGPLAEVSLYAAFRNTLVAVIVLFAMYLVFEFQTLWFREFPKGFHYSGYAHEGAAWLTMALGAATVLLSVMFRGSMLSDPRVPRLRGLSWWWSLENLLLAVSVYHRLCIYVGFNGLTRMRMVGFLGITSVVVGFALVLWMIANRRNFTWLLRRQLWTVAFAVYLYAVLPIDHWVNQYNVRRILVGDLAPCVQISVHATSTEGLLQLLPLVEHSHPTIKSGVRAILCDAFHEHRAKSQRSTTIGWTELQGADLQLMPEISAAINGWPEAVDATYPEAKHVFREWAYQWY